MTDKKRQDTELEKQASTCPNTYRMQPKKSAVFSSSKGKPFGISFEWILMQRLDLRTAL